MTRHAPEGLALVPALSVRTLFDALLQEIRPQVAALSAVTIADMAALAAQTAETRALDLDLDSLAPCAAPDADVDLIVVAWLFGRRFAASLPDLAAPGRLIVEDCAQAYDGRLSLSPGADVALYSFGPIKTASALGGAVGLFRDPALADRIRARLSAHPPLTDSWFLRRVAKYAALKLLVAPPIYGLLFRLILAAGRDPDTKLGGLARGFSGSDALTARIRRTPPPRLLTLLERRLRLWRPPVAEDAATEALLQSLDRTPGRAAPGRWWVAPILVDDPCAMIEKLRRQGYDATRGATSLRALDAAPQAAHLMSRIVYLPRPRDRIEAKRLAAAVAAAISPP